MASCQVRVLTLNKGENLETTLFRLEKDWHLRFVLGPSLHASTVRLYCNHPPKKEVPFERTTYYELEWKSSSGSKSDSHDVYTEISMVIAGSFNYYFTIDNSGDIENADGQGYFLVDPTLSVGEQGKQYTLDCLQCQSVISKCLGHFDDWEGRLYVSKATGYNLIHFTPIQALGKSNSAYSIKDQLKLNPVYIKEGQNYDFNNVEGLIKKMNREWEVLSLTDLVYNHTANNSEWLQEHPECGYNMENSPHLKPAYLLDRILHHFSLEVAEGKWASQGIPPTISKEADIQKIREVLLYEVLPGFKMHEFYTVNIDDIMKRFKHGIEENRVIKTDSKKLELIQDPRYERNGCRIDMDVALKLYNTDRPGAINREQRIKKCCEFLKGDLDAINKERLDALHDHLNTAVNNFMANIRWRFLNEDGPKIKQVTEREPLMHDYFIVSKKYTGSVGSEETHMNGDGGKYVFACNGWVMGDDPLRNFAESGSNIYLRRELVGWGDSAKLRYGQKPEDCPYLWQRMKEYSEITARIFHGVRLDNCHSTPIHVAEYMLDAARKIRPDLYVIAELFTGGEHLDNLFINKLGINSLIREAMSAENSHKLGSLLHRYGGQPVGAFIQPRMKPLVRSMAHAVFYDQTHDNPSPIKTKSAYDMLPTAALVSMACCATGSNRGYDQMIPHHIHVVNEERKYTSWADWEFPDRPYINQTFGISRAKTLLNNLHFMMGDSSVANDLKEKHNFSQVYVDQVDEHTVSVTRHNPVTHESIVLIARTAFSKPQEPEKTPYIRPVTLQGMVETILFEIQTLHTEAYEYTEDSDYINGLPDYYLKLQENIPPSLSKMVRVNVTGDGMCSLINFETFTPGSVIAFRCVLPQPALKAILEIRRGLGQFGYLMRSYSGRKLFDETVDTSNFRSIVSALTLNDLNVALFRCKQEEEADGNGFSVYNIPGYGDFNYCGLRGVTTVLGQVRSQNDLGHPLCCNLRDGDWLPSYIANRLLVYPGTKNLGVWFQNLFQHLAKVPRYLIPSYFDAIITGAYVILRQQVFGLMSDFVADGSTFIQALAMGSVMFCGYVKNSRLPFLSPDLEPPKPPTIKVETKDGSEEEEACLSLAAGFPHFASSYMRNWGRDTFIALRGLLLLTGRYQEARYIILAYGGCLRHGLIPNLLNEGTGARFNCRDATWFWLQAIQDYCKIVPDGKSILKDKVSRLYPEDDSEAQKPGKYDQPLFEVMQEAVQRHAVGPNFRERNAGHKIDSEMTTQGTKRKIRGFNLEIGVKWETGFVYGGNEHNCGTWMDKMGSSQKAGIKGKPATPRDGSAVELIGLSASCLLWLHNLNEEGVYPYSGVKLVKHGSEELMTFKAWHELLCANFERCFWVNTEPDPAEEAPELIFRRGIYKDTYNATQFWTNTQLRPNYPISMVVAPELFTPERAWTALQTAQDNLLGPLGMKTLDPSDWSYVPFYDNANDSEDAKIAKGFSYHQGPEWVWPIGYFLRAKLIFARKLESSRPGILRETVMFIRSTLTRHYEEVMKSSWRSLPELTNHNAEPNKFCCPAQAWSVSCVLDVLYDLEKLDTDVTIQPSKSTENLVVAPV
ncbi:glycogen debranching enzyme-like isoform X1 [Ruditapes philippinarum]|uniref:glycogen debranching enzyme-like isoform X1 n=1 Tax=Ruditapes philippinarum TaxID=129788 RepID=UPI00295A6E4F|nr:glycogen debranching enzyme-like isoform X1 [Ruditapes philippinarum]